MGPYKKYFEVDLKKIKTPTKINFSGHLEKSVEKTGTTFELTCNAENRQIEYSHKWQ